MICYPVENSESCCRFVFNLISKLRAFRSIVSKFGAHCYMMTCTLINIGVFDEISSTCLNLSIFIQKCL